mmetsp:Transcript_838/g.1284  ORF Transcript_838/g.1284 Transcript_838/m.1284 type:complete len:284 (-) Transcript_838:413-1264(-)
MPQTSLKLLMRIRYVPGGRREYLQIFGKPPEPVLFEVVGLDESLDSSTCCSWRLVVIWPPLCSADVSVDTAEDLFRGNVGSTSLPPSPPTTSRPPSPPALISFPLVDRSSSPSSCFGCCCCCCCCGCGTGRRRRHRWSGRSEVGEWGHDLRLQSTAGFGRGCTGQLAPQCPSHAADGSHLVQIFRKGENERCHGRGRPPGGVGPQWLGVFRLPPRHVRPPGRAAGALPTADGDASLRLRSRRLQRAHPRHSGGDPARRWLLVRHQGDQRAEAGCQGGHYSQHR